MNDAEQMQRVLHFLRASTARIASVVHQTTSRAAGAEVYKRERDFNELLRVIVELNPDSDARMDAIERARKLRQRNQMGA
jgi:hypothetical protein